MRRILLVGIFVLTSTLFISVGAESNSRNSVVWWEVQSIDTVKYSRDLSREMMNNKGFDEEMDSQIKKIAQTGATHVSIGTPYDKEFVPMLERWVSASRKYDLNVWFRGNLSGWEGWFNYDGISRDEHMALTKEFILSNGDLFEDGDIFTACTECENGGPGDPRLNGDVNGHRKFLINEYRVTSDSFRKIGKNVQSNYNSMNGDVAKLIMDEETTKALGGIVVIDHYVSTPEKLVKDIRNLANTSKGKVVLGEFGVPITDVHGRMTDQMQKDWLSMAFEMLIKEPDLIGVNYWVNKGSTAGLWTGNGEPKPAVDVVSFYFKPKVLSGRAVNELGKPVDLVKITSGVQEDFSDENGNYTIPYYSKGTTVNFSVVGYDEKATTLAELEIDSDVQLIKTDPGVIFRILRLFHNLFN